MNKLIYLDNAATTKTAPEVVEAMLPYFTENYGNPSSVYSFASKNKEAISKQRDIIADALELLPKETIIQRLTGDGGKDDLIAPLWSLKKFCVLNEIDKEMVRRNTYQGFHYI